MMDFEEFTQQVAKEVKRFLPEKYDDASVTLQDVTKNNDQQLTGLMIKTEDTNIAPNIYLEGYFEQYQDGKDFEDIVRDIADGRVRHELNQDFDVSKITDFDQVKDHIICKLVNAEMNAEYLADKPHTQVEDLAVMYAVDLGGGEGGKMTAPITNALMEQYGVTTQELHDIAIHNLAESQIEFKTMRDVLIDMMFPDGISENDPRAFMIPPEEENPSMYVLSNAEKLNGAAALLDAKTMEDISEKLGGDFIVLPSSIHECIVLPVNEDLDRHTLEAMVQDVNAGQVAPEERLSDHVYMYDSQEKELVLADKMEERLQQRAEAQKEEKSAEQGDRPGKAERGEKKPERERVSMKEKLPEKKAEVAKNEASREHPVPAKTKETALA